MSVLHLRRDMVVAEEPVIEIETPFPLVTIDGRTAETVVADNDGGGAGSLARRIGRTIRALFFVCLLSIYPALVVLSSGVGDRDAEALVDRTQWSAPWAGGAATLIEHHYKNLGWASDAPSWAPMGLLTAKPAYQSALAEAIGEYVSLAARQSAAAGLPDTDLDAAARLLNANSTGVQLRASRDALVSYDGRVRNRAGETMVNSENLDARFSLIQQWGKRSQSELVMSSSVISGSPLDEAATRAVYAAKGRAQAAYLFLDTIAWPEDSRAVAARAEALAAWRAAARFHPIFVFNGEPDGAMFGNHASSMGFLVGQALEATDSYLAYFPRAPQQATSVAAAEVGIAPHGEFTTAE